MLNPHLQAFLIFSRQGGLPKLSDLGVEQVRNSVKKLAVVTAIPPQSPPEVETRTLPSGRNLYVLQPERTDPNARLPLIVYVHGGGFAMYDPEDYFSLCQYLCRETGAVVVLPQYRLAPEHKFPVAHEDVFETMKWIGVHSDELGVNRDRIIIAGDSAGGNICAAASFRLQQHGMPVFLQVLLYPVLVFRRHFPSHDLYGQGYFIDMGTLDWVWGLYKNTDLPEQEMLNDTRIHPFLETALGNLPDMLMVVGEYDLLRDECVQFHERIVAAGGRSELMLFGDMAHNFALMAGKVPGAKTALNKVIAGIKERLSAAE